MCQLVTRASRPIFICLRIKKISNFRAEMTFQKCHRFIHETAKNFALFLSLLQSMLPLHKENELWKTRSDRNIHCFSKLGFLYVKTLVFLLCTFLEEEMSIPEHSHQKNFQFFENVHICLLSNWYNAGITAWKVEIVENGRQKGFYVNAKE